MRTRGQKRRLVAQLTVGSLFLLPANANAQLAGGKPADFLKDAGKSFVLEHARLIDGTGNAARADVTVVVENGRIVEEGSPGELRGRGRLFQKMWRLQADGMAVQ